MLEWEVTVHHPRLLDEKTLEYKMVLTLRIPELLKCTENKARKKKIKAMIQIRVLFFFIVPSSSLNLKEIGITISSILPPLPRHISTPSQPSPSRNSNRRRSRRTLPPRVR